MRHKALASYPGVYVSLLIVTVFLGSAQGGAVGTRLIFPDLTQAPSVAVGYAVLNPLAQATEVTFTAYGVGGALLDGPGVTNPVTLDVGPRSQLARFPADLFGFALDSEVTGWMEVTSDSEEIKGFFITVAPGRSLQSPPSGAGFRPAVPGRHGHLLRHSGGPAAQRLDRGAPPERRSHFGGRVDSLWRQPGRCV